MLHFRSTRTPAVQTTSSSRSRINILGEMRCGGSDNILLGNVSMWIRIFRSLVLLRPKFQVYTSVARRWGFFGLFVGSTRLIASSGYRRICHGFHKVGIPLVVGQRNYLHPSMSRILGIRRRRRTLLREDRTFLPPGSIRKMARRRNESHCYHRPHIPRLL